MAFLHLEKKEGLVNLKPPREPQHGPFSSKLKMRKMPIHNVVLAYSSSIIIESGSFVQLIFT